MSVGAARKLASEIAEIYYEGSGIGPFARIEGARIAAVRASEKPDSAFPADVARDAEEAAIAAITRIMRGG